MLENIGNTITRLAIDLLGRNLAGRIPSRSRHVRRNEVAMATAVAALDIQQLWAAGGRTPLDRLGRNLGGRIHHVPNIGNTITPLTMGPIGMTLG